MSRWLKKGMVLGASILTLSGLSVFFLLLRQSPACACAPNTHGRHLSTILRAQQAYYLETGQFANQASLETWWAISLLTLSAHHSYSVEKTPTGDASDRDIAYVYAVPPDANFYPKVGPFSGPPKPAYFSVVGALTFDQPSATFKEIRCASNEASDQKLAPPTFIGGAFYCPAGATVFDAQSAGEEGWDVFSTD